MMRGEGLMRDGHGPESGGGWLPDVMWGMMIWLLGGDGRARLIALVSCRVEPARYAYGVPGGDCGHR